MHTTITSKLAEIGRRRIGNGKPEKRLALFRRIAVEHRDDALARQPAIHRRRRERTRAPNRDALIRRERSRHIVPGRHRNEAVEPDEALENRTRSLALQAGQLVFLGAHHGADALDFRAMPDVMNGALFEIADIVDDAGEAAARPRAAISPDRDALERLVACERLVEARRSDGNCGTPARRSCRHSPTRSG